VSRLSGGGVANAASPALTKN